MYSGYSKSEGIFLAVAVLPERTVDILRKGDDAARQNVYDDLVIQARVHSLPSVLMSLTS